MYQKKIYYRQLWFVHWWRQKKIKHIIIFKTMEFLLYFPISHFQFQAQIEWIYKPYKVPCPINVSILDHNTIEACTQHVCVTLIRINKLLKWNESKKKTEENIMRTLETFYWKEITSYNFRKYLFFLLFILTQKQANIKKQQKKPIPEHRFKMNPN